MEYRSLGRTGVKVSPFCLGCLLFGGRTDEAESFRIMDRAMDAGFNFFDTANIYNEGRSEEVVGRALKRNGKRGRIVLATKVYWSMDESDPNARGTHRRHIIEQCEASLRRLQTDFVDLYQLHRPSSETPIDETLRALDDLVRAGKVRYVGTSTFAAWQLMESLWASKEHGLNRFVSEQPPYNLLDRRIERELVPMAQTYGLALLPWSPLARGFLTGQYRRDRRVVKGARYKPENQWDQEHFIEPAFRVVDEIESISREKGCTLAQFVLAWCGQQPGITSPIIGPRTVEHLESGLAAAEVKVTAEDRARLDTVAPPGGMIVPYYEADFGPHRYRW